MALGAGQDGLLSTPHQLDGPTCLPYEQRKKRLNGHVFFAAEAPAHVGADVAHAMLWQPKDVRDLARVFDYLGRNSKSDDTVRIYPANAGLGLEIGVIDRM
jgi:hypothetical protein